MALSACNLAMPVNPQVRSAYVDKNTCNTSCPVTWPASIKRTTCHESGHENQESEPELDEELELDEPSEEPELSGSDAASSWGDAGAFGLAVCFAIAADFDLLWGFCFILALALALGFGAKARAASSSSSSSGWAGSEPALHLLL